MIRNILAILLLFSVTLIAAQEQPPYDGDSNRPKPNQRSLVIVFDTTGSMGNELEQVRREAKAIVEHAAVLPENPFYNFIFVDFNDPTVGTVLVTNQKNVLLSRLQKITVGGGGDCPELAMEGIRRALEKALYKSQIFVFTDAPAKDHALENEVTRLIQEKQATITFFITQGCGIPSSGDPLYNRLTQLSGGQAYRLTEYDISKVMQVTRDTLDIQRDIVYVEDFKTAKKDTYVVSEKTKDITVSITGAKPNVKFTDPNNEIFAVEPRVALDNVKIYQINNPKPGPWVIDVNVEKAGRLQVTQVSALSFEFGFSLSPPVTIKETFVRPLRGIENHLAVAPLNMPAGYTFTHVTITTPNSTKEYDLSESTPGIFITEKFQQPELFKVTIHGKDTKGNSIKRLISTSIQPENESKPSITIIEPELRVLQYNGILLRCTAKSFSQMTVKWIKAGVVLKEMAASQSYELDHNIEMASLDDHGEYVCVASNLMGNTEGKISLTVTPRRQPMPIVTIYPEAKELRVNGTIRIKCTIKYPYDSTYWTKFKQNTIDTEMGNTEVVLNPDQVQADRTLVISYVTANHAGTYACVAKVNETEVKDSVYIAVGHEPEITDSFEETLIESTGSSTELTCRATGLPKPKFEWYFVEPSDVRKQLASSTDTVTIEKLNFTNDGKYECAVSNGIGTTQKRIIELKVKARNVPVLVNPINSPIVARFDETRSLVCECDQCLPMRSSTWTFNDIPINETKLGNVRVDYANDKTDHFKSTLIVDRVAPENEGVYKCELENDLNSASHEVRLNILQKPTIQEIVVSNSKISETGEHIILENTSFTLDCQLTVDLQPTFEWFKDEAHVASEQHLKLDTVTYKDTGTYRCAVNNSEGSDTMSAMVQVNGPPRIVNEFPEELVKLTGVKLEVECNVTGFPLPKVRWENENGHEVKTTNGVLQLDDYINHFSSIFRCYAENSVRVVNKTAVIKYQQDIMVENKALQLYCPLPDTGKVDWYKNDEKIEKSSPLFFVVQSIMQFAKPDAVNYTGTYRCEADHKEHHFNVTMVIPPTIEAIEVFVDKVATSLEKDVLTVRVGQEVTVRCLVKGHPTPKVYWRTKRRFLDGDATLHITSVEQKHVGIYNCFARLDSTKDKKQFNLKVLP